MKQDLWEFLCVAVPKVLGGALLLIFNLILLRYFGPEQFGMFSVCVVWVILADAILGAGIDMGMLRLAPLYHNARREYSLQIQQTGLFLKALGALVLCLPVVIFARPLSRTLFQQPGCEELLYLSLAFLLGVLALRSAQMYFQVGRSFFHYGIADLSHSALRFGCLAAFLALGVASPAEVLGLYAAASVCVAFAILSTAGRGLLQPPAGLQAMHELLSVAKWYLATAAVGSVVSRVDIFLVASLSGVKEAGIFSAAQTIALVPQLIGTYWAVVFSPRVMPLWTEGTLYPLYRRFQIKIMIVCLVIYGLALLGMQGLASYLMPPAFHRASGVILILLPGTLCALVNFPWTISVLLFTRPRFLFLFDSFAFPLLFLIYAQVIPKYGSGGAAAVTTAFALIKTAVTQVVAFRILRSEGRKSELHGEIPPSRELEALGGL